MKEVVIRIRECKPDDGFNCGYLFSIDGVRGEMHSLDKEMLCEDISDHVAEWMDGEKENWSEEDEARQDIVGQNGNNGDHYTIAGMEESMKQFYGLSIRKISADDDNNITVEEVKKEDFYPPFDDEFTFDEERIYAKFVKRFIKEHTIVGYEIVKRETIK